MHYIVYRVPKMCLLKCTVCCTLLNGIIVTRKYKWIHKVQVCIRKKLYCYIKTLENERYSTDTSYTLTHTHTLHECFQIRFQFIRVYLFLFLHISFFFICSVLLNVCVCHCFEWLLAHFKGTLLFDFFG